MAGKKKKSPISLIYKELKQMSSLQTNSDHLNQQRIRGMYSIKKKMDHDKRSPLKWPLNSSVQTVKRLPAMRETWVRSLGREDPLEKETATHSSLLAWRIPWTEEPGGLQSTGSQRVGHNWATSLKIVYNDRFHCFHFCVAYYAPQISLCTSECFL